MSDTALEETPPGDEPEADDWPSMEAAATRIREAAERDAAAAEADESDEVDPAVDGGDEGAAAGGDHSAPLAVCPFCEQGTVDPTEALDRLKAIVANLEPFEQSPRFATCPECDGWGAVLTGARMPSAGVQPCPNCDGQGYVARHLVTTAAVNGPPAVTPEPPSGDLPAGDPLTIPPEQGGAGAPGMEWSPQLGRWAYPAGPANG